MKYTINAIQQKHVNVSFSLGDETLTVGLNNMPTHDDAALDRALSDYALEYVASRTVTVDAAVIAKVGVEQDVKAALAEEVVQDGLQAEAAGEA